MLAISRSFIQDCFTMNEQATDTELFSADHETLFADADTECFMRLVRLIETIHDARDGGDHIYASELMETYLGDYPVELVRLAQEYLNSRDN